MELGYTISYIFEDKDWVKKLIPLAALGLASLIPVFGLLAAAPALGFLLQLARNVRQGMPRPLPIWNDWQVKFEIGGQFLLAIILYHLPLLFIFLCTTFSLNIFTGSFMGDAVNILVICCTTPILLIYLGIVWPILAIGATEFIETNEWQRLFRPLHLWDVLRTNGSLAFRWLLYNLLVNFVLGLLLLIPCLGWMLILIFGYPIQGHLLGQFAHRLSLSNKPQTPLKRHPARG